MKKVKKVKNRNYYEHQKKQYYGLFTAALIFLAIAYLFGVINKNIKPTLTAIAEARAKNMATEAISKAVLFSLDDHLKYEDLIDIQRSTPPTEKSSAESTSTTSNSTYGMVTSITAKTIVMNKIAAQITQNINKELLSMEQKTQIRIPIGSLLGSQMLANYGPSLRLRVLPIGSANVTYATEFTSSGINQTRHRIYLKVVANVRVVMPLLTSNKEPVESLIPIAETVIVGPIPNSYIDTTTDNGLNFLND